MPVIKSAIKKMRQDVKRRQTNRLRKERLRTIIKAAQKVPTAKNIQTAVSLIDKMAKVDLIHGNKAARLKSQVSRLLAKGGKQIEGKRVSPPAKKAKSTRVKKKTQDKTS